MKTKYEAVEHFYFIKDIYKRVKGAGNDNLELCGVLFKDNYAYTTNAHIVGRVTINDDFPADNPLFWTYNKTEDNIDKFNAERFMLNIGRYINEEYDDIANKNDLATRSDCLFCGYFENIAFFKTAKLMDFILSEYNSVAKMAKMCVNIEIKDDVLNFKFIPIKKSTSVFESEFQSEQVFPPGMITLRHTEENKCTINLLYFYEIIKNSYSKKSYIGIKHNNDLTQPVILFADDDMNDEVYWAISQKIGVKKLK